MSKQLDPAVVSSLGDAVRELESRSCAEVVVEVRARSGSYAHADARCAALLAFGGLLVLLFSPWPVQAAWVAVDVAVLYAMGIAVARRSDRLRRLVTTEADRARRVRTVATSVFFERGIANLEKETGVLLYLSLLERRIEVVPDHGVLNSVPHLEWNMHVNAATSSLSATPETLLGLIRSLAPFLAKCLPRRAGDRDELPDAPRFVAE
jgi:putative membrane protein